jgi:hypothetical protein
MGLFFWKDNGKINLFAAALAEDLFSHVQPEVARQHFIGSPLDNKKKQRKIEQRFHALIGQMQEFCSTNSLGIYGKARLQLVETIVLRNL